MEQNVRYYWIQELVNHLFLNYTICVVNTSFMPKFASKTQQIQEGNGLFVSVLFIIPMILDVHGHKFEIYTLVLEIHENVDLVLDDKNLLN